MNLKIDYREKDFIKLVKPLQNDLNLKIDFEICTLPIGDFIICDGKDELLIIERKKLTDLATSIKDGRYAEQSYRLDGNECPNHNVVYLIEGKMEEYRSKYTKIPKKTLYSTMFCLQYYKGFSVIRTVNVVETVEVVLRMVDKLKREKNKYGYYHLKFEKSSEKYNEVVKKIKKSNVTPENVGKIMLSQIPGISNKIATAVMDKYKTISNLIHSDLKDLEKITYDTTTGKKRRISNTSIVNLRNFLFLGKEDVLCLDI